MRVDVVQLYDEDVDEEQRGGAIPVNDWYQSLYVLDVQILHVQQGPQAWESLRYAQRLGVSPLCTKAGSRVLHGTGSLYYQN